MKKFQEHIEEVKKSNSGFANPSKVRDVAIKYLNDYINDKIEDVQLKNDLKKFIKEKTTTKNGYRLLKPSDYPVIVNKIEEETSFEFKLLKSAFKKTLGKYKLNKLKHEGYLFAFIDWVSPYVVKLVNKLLNENKSIKIFLTMKCKFINPLKEDANFRGVTTNAFNILNLDIENKVNEVLLDLVEKIDNLEFRGSGWIFDKILEFNLDTTSYEPMKKGSSYVELPEYIRNKKAVLNIKNNDDKCFLYSVLASLYPVNSKSHPEIPKKYAKHESKVNMNNVEYPVAVGDRIYKTIENQNEFSINIFSYDKKEQYFYPLYYSHKNSKEAINLLFLDNHYTLIKDFSRLLSDQTKHDGKTYFCNQCMHGYSTKTAFDNHEIYCTNSGLAYPELPKVGINDKIKFKNYGHKMRIPFVIYADFEAITKVIERETVDGEDEEELNTQKYQEHIPCGFCINVVSICPEYQIAPIVYRGEDTITRFFEEIKKIRDQVLLHLNKEMIITPTEEKEYKKSTVCHICDGKIDDPKNWKVRDHCHVTGKYRGPAHKNCNVNFKLKKRIPVIFHNLKNYDSHFMIREASKKHFENIDCIPLNSEKYITFNLDELTFMDSYQFMASSLDSLSTNLKKGGLDNFIECKKKFKNNEQLDLITSKGVYPYDFMNTFDKFNLPSLPSMKDFHSQLSEKDITKKAYNHAHNVWQKFNIQNMGEYHDLYLLSDVLILSDVCENFRNTSISNYGLDPFYYLTAPGLAWDAMLFKTKIELELITDNDKYEFLEKGKRGGISTIIKRYAKANNKYMLLYNKEEASKYIMYLDANNLYGWAMCQSLPYSCFRWLEEEEINKLDLTKNRENDDKSYFLEVDLEYPAELHNLHNDYPLAPENVEVSVKTASPYTQKLANLNGILNWNPCNKLVPNLNNKEKYVLHLRNLQLYLSLGLKLTKIYRVMEFKQKPWLKEYIDFNTIQRSKAKNEFEKDFYKLMNNSVFGKTMENVRNRIDGKLCNTEEKKKKRVNDIRFKSFHIYDENLAFVELRKKKVILDKPIYAGCAILDLSKVLMYDFHYNYIKKNYNDKANLLFTDTDSLTYEIETEDLYQDFYNDKQLFDFSDYPKESCFKSDENKKIIGKFKDETKGVPIREFIGLRSKLYSVLLDREVEDPVTKEMTDTKNTCKGITKAVKDKYLSHDKYLLALTSGVSREDKVKTIRSFDHELFSVEINKISLSAIDDKRYILNDGINTLAYGNCAIQANH